MQGSGLWAQINGLKKIVCEPRGTGDLFDKAMSDYYSAIRRGKGGIFMAICRGKVCTPFLTCLRRTAAAAKLPWIKVPLPLFARHR